MRKIKKLLFIIFTIISLTGCSYSVINLNDYAHKDPVEFVDTKELGSEAQQLLKDYVNEIQGNTNDN